MSNLVATLIAVSPPPGTYPLGSIKPITDAYSKGSDIADGSGAVLNMQTLISNMIGLITLVGALFFLVEFFLGAFKWISSGGDKGKVATAQASMTNGAIGMIIMIATYAVIGLLGSVIGINILDPGAEIMKLVPGALPPAVPSP